MPKHTTFKTQCQPINLARYELISGNPPIDLFNDILFRFPTLKHPDNFIWHIQQIYYNIAKGTQSGCGVRIPQRNSISKTKHLQGKGWRPTYVQKVCDAFVKAGYVEKFDGYWYSKELKNTSLFIATKDFPIVDDLVLVRKRYSGICHQKNKLIFSGKVL